MEDSWIMDTVLWDDFVTTEEPHQQRQHSSVTKRAMNTPQAQLEAQRRWRMREKMRVQDLQAELESKAAAAAQLQNANAALRRKQTLLEAVVAVRDDQLKTLQKEARQRTIERASCPTPLPITGSPLDRAGSAPHPLSQVILRANSDDGSDRAAALTHTASATGVCGGWLTAPPAATEPLPKLQMIPPHTEWDAAWIERLRQTTSREWQGLWLELVKEVSMHVLSAEAHGPGSQAHDCLTQVVSRYLGIVDRITLLAPHVYYESLAVNLVSGEKQDPPKGHWGTVAKAINVTPSQVRECMTTLEAFDDAMEPVIQERVKLSAKLALHNTPQGSTTDMTSLLAPAAAPNTAPMVTDASTSDAPVSSDNNAAVSPALLVPDATARATLVPGGAGEIASVGELVQLMEQLSNNLARQHAAHNTVSDFLCTRVLTVVQLARAAAVSWPWLPDVTQILREGVTALAAEEQTDNPNTKLTQQ